MIYIFTALMAEAKPFINEYQLKKDSSFNHYQVFRNDEMILTITGTGKVRAAMAVTEVCTRIPPASCDVMLNAGICGVRDDVTQVGECFIINKITDDTTECDFYPDIIYDTGLPERSLRTVSLPMYMDNQLTDMEAAGLFEAAAMFYTSDKMNFIKTVSDTGKCGAEAENVNADKILSVMNGLLDKLKPFLEQVLVQENEVDEGYDDILVHVEKLSEDMRLSATMSAGLKQLFRYLWIEGEDCEKLINRIYSENTFPLKSKNEGKRIYDGINEAVFTHLR